MTIAMISRIRRYVASCALTLILAVPSPLEAQAPASPPQAAAPTTQTLHILVLAGRDGRNDLETGAVSLLAVQVLDRNDLPVEDAEVVFRFPLSGPSATFADGQNSQIVRTDASGQARATGWTANNQAGSFVVQITASQGSEQGSISVPMANVRGGVSLDQADRKPWWRSKWAFIAYAAAAAAVIVLANTGDDSVTIQARPGAPSVGGPQ